MKVTSILHSKEIFEIEPISTGNLHLEGRCAGMAALCNQHHLCTAHLELCAPRAAALTAPPLPPGAPLLPLQIQKPLGNLLWRKKKEFYLHQGGSWGQVPGKFMLTSERPGPIRDYFSPSCSWSKN